MRGNPTPSSVGGTLRNEVTPAHDTSAAGSTAHTKQDSPLLIRDLKEDYSNVLS